MNEQRQQQWQHILLLTQQMRELAVPNDSLTDLSVEEEYAKQPWQAISKIESDRFQLLEQFFEKPPAQNEATELAEGIKQIQATDLELFSISQNIKNEIGSVFSNLGNAQRAASAYSDTAKP